MKIAKRVFILLTIFMCLQLNPFFQCNLFSNQAFAGIVKYDIQGYIAPNFTITENTMPGVKASFNVEILELSMSTQTDNNGYFEIKGVPQSLTGYTIKISKATFLYRSISNVVVNSNLQIGSQDLPVEMWVGDLPINGTQDNAINSADVQEVNAGYNAAYGDTNYTVDRDLNKDYSINTQDIMLIAAHYNSSPSSYPSVTPTALTTGSISIVLDKTTATIGDIVRASVVVNNINNIAACQVNIKYDQNVLQPITHDSRDFYTESTIPTIGDLLVNEDYSPLSFSYNNLENGIINFSSVYMDQSTYKLSNAPEATGTLAVIDFKVLNDISTNISFEDTINMPDGILGTNLIDWDANVLSSGYSVIQAPQIN